MGGAGTRQGWFGASEGAFVVLEEGDRKIGDRNMKGRAIFLSSIFLSWRFRFRVITSREMSLLTPSRFLTSAGLDYAIHSGLAERVLGRAGKGMLSCPVRGLELPPEGRMTNGGTG